MSRRKIKKKKGGKKTPAKPSVDTASLLQTAFHIYQSGRIQKAEKIYKKILKADPRCTSALYYLYLIALRDGKVRVAIDCLHKAIKNEPQNAKFYYMLGNLHLDLRQFDNAVSCYKKALDREPDFVSAYYNMGIALHDLGRLDEAISSYQQAIQLKPDLHAPYYNLGLVLEDQGKLEDSISYHEKALQLKFDYFQALSHLVLNLQATCNWKRLEDLRNQLSLLTDEALKNGVLPPEQPFYSLYRVADPSRNFAVAKSWSDNISNSIASFKNLFPPRVQRTPKEQIIIGYLSNDFRDHPVSHLINGLFRLHNRNGFHVLCYSYGEDDGSVYRRRIEEDCDRFIDLRELDDFSAAKRICDDKVDILVDLMGHTSGSRLTICAFRPAPIQVSYLGFLGTTGADFLDYIITDRIVTPEDQASFYSENFVYMPHCYQVNDHTQAILNKDFTKEDFGLPEAGFVFCSFNNSYKIEPVMFDIWMKILRQVSESVLWLQQRNETAAKNLRQEAEARGVKPERLIFSGKLPLDQHLARLTIADLALDTRIYNGGATTSNALWAGVPVITLQGSHFVSRMSSSSLTAIGMSELITHSLEEYETFALRLAHNPDELEAIRQRLAKNRLRKPLFDTPRFVKNLEKAYKEMWDIFLAGERPRQIEVIES